MNIIENMALIEIEEENTAELTSTADPLYLLRCRQLLICIPLELPGPEHMITTRNVKGLLK